VRRHRNDINRVTAGEIHDRLRRAAGDNDVGVDVDARLLGEAARRLVELLVRLLDQVLRRLVVLNERRIRERHVHVDGH
jgi:hypothetical protein